MNEIGCLLYSIITIVLLILISKTKIFSKKAIIYPLFTFFYIFTMYIFTKYKISSFLLYSTMIIYVIITSLLQNESNDDKKENYFNRLD